MPLLKRNNGLTCYQPADFYQKISCFTLAILIPTFSILLRFVSLKTK